MSIEKGQIKRSAASLQSFQLHFKVIVLAVLLARSSGQQCPNERAHFLCQAKYRLISSLLCIQINVTRKQLKNANAATLLLFWLHFFDTTVS